MSPIGDALDRIEENGSSISEDADVARSDDLASELSKMAENDSDLAKAVEARLRGAKVRFDGTSPTIETQSDPELDASTPYIPDAVSGGPTQQTGVRKPIPSLADAVPPVRQRDRRTATAPPLVTTTIDQTPDPPPAEITHMTRRRLNAGKIVRAIPFVLIVLFLILGFDRTVSIISVGVILGLGVLIVAGLVAATSRVGRKTTSMFRDDTR